MKFTKMVKTALWSLLLVLFATSAANAAVTLEGCAERLMTGLSGILCSQEDAEDGSTIITVTSKPNSTQYLEDLKYSYSVPIIVNGKLNTLSMMGSLVENQTPLDGKYTLTVDKTKSVTFKATFANKSQQSLTLQANFGGVLYATTSTTPVKKDFGEYAIDALPVSSGDIAYVTLKPNPGYKVSGVLATYMNGSLTEGGSLKTVQVYEAGNDKYYFRMPAYSLNVKATFDYVDYTISKPTVTGGTYTVTTANGKTTAIVGEKVTVKPIPTLSDEEAYIIGSVTYTEEGSTTPVNLKADFVNDGCYWFNMPANNVTINVKFTRLKKVTVAVQGNGSVTLSDPTWTSPKGNKFYRNEISWSYEAAPGYYLSYAEQTVLDEVVKLINSTDQTRVSGGPYALRTNSNSLGYELRVSFTKKDLAITNEIEDSHCQVEDLRSTAQVGDDVSFKVSCDEGYGMDAVALYNATMKVPVDGGTTLDKGTGYYHFTMPEIPVLIRGTAKYGITVVDEVEQSYVDGVSHGSYILLYADATLQDDPVLNQNRAYEGNYVLISAFNEPGYKTQRITYSYLNGDGEEVSAEILMEKCFEGDCVTAGFEMPAAPVTVKVERAKFHGITVVDDNPGAETEFYGKKPADFDPDLKFVAGEMVTVNAKSVSGEPVNVYYSYVDAVKGKQTVQLEMKTASWDVDPVNPWLEATFEMPAAPVVVRVVRSISHSIILSDEVENGISVYDASDPMKKMLTSAYQMERVNIEVLEFDEHPVDKVIASFTNSKGVLEKHKIAIERAMCDGVPCQVGYFMMQNTDVTITVVREKIRYSVSMESDEENSEFYIFEDEEDSDEEYREYAFVGEIVALQLSKVEGAKLVVSYDVYEGTEKKNTVTIDLSGKEYEAGFMFVDFVMPANNVVIHVTHVKEESGSGETGSGDEGGETLPKFYNIGKTIVKNGKITVDGEMPAGETVTFKAVPNEGYVLDAITITKTGDSKTTVTSKAVSGKKDTYKFTMPEYDVTISVTFKAAEVEGEEDGDDEDSDDEKSEYVVASVSVPQFSVIASGRSLQISGVRAGSDIAVFSMQGKLIKKMRAQVSTIETVLPNAGSYMVKVGNAAKVVNVR